METFKLSFGQIRLILKIAKYYDLNFDDIYFQYCGSLKEFSEYCEHVLKDLSETFVKSPDVTDFERGILEDYYYKSFFSIWGSEDFPYILYVEDYNLIIEIPITYSFREEENLDLSLDLDYRLLSIYYYTHINNLKY